MARPKPPSQRRAARDLPEALSRTTRGMVAALRHQGVDESTIRRKIASAFRRALTLDVPDTREFDLGRGLETCLTTDGVYWCIFERFGCDRSDAHLQESWWAIVERAIGDGLAGPDTTPED